MQADGRHPLLIGLVAIGVLVVCAVFVSYLFIPLAILVAFLVVFGAVDRAQ